MDSRLCLATFFILGYSWCCTARDLPAGNLIVSQTEDDNVSALQMNNNLEEGRQDHRPTVEEVDVNEKLCTLCEEYTARAVKYMANNKTQTEIIELLHKSCLKMRFYKQECTILVDLYAPLFFVEINKMGPEEFCEEFGFCGLGITSHVLSGKIELQFMPPTSY
ncbi:hypothetical protein CQW23_29496 [Capsicum baccatum]|uniref:Saposin B-type domain-containing protein n=1 Tax=Capsicum baccatum TaxID=33114 RepID=A0A2G2VJM9_CAPBA|nr:hypothetical protein CQW23_29496 [Capsicum baccatum]